MKRKQHRKKIYVKHDHMVKCTNIFGIILFCLGYGRLNRGKKKYIIHTQRKKKKPTERPKDDCFSCSPVPQGKTLLFK